MKKIRKFGKDMLSILSVPWKIIQTICVMIVIAGLSITYTRNKSELDDHLKSVKKIEEFKKMDSASKEMNSQYFSGYGALTNNYSAIGTGVGALLSLILIGMTIQYRNIDKCKEKENEKEEADRKIILDGLKIIEQGLNKYAYGEWKGITLIERFLEIRNEGSASVNNDNISKMVGKYFDGMSVILSSIDANNCKSISILYSYKRLYFGTMIEQVYNWCQNEDKRPVNTRIAALISNEANAYRSNLKKIPDVVNDIIQSNERI